MEKDFPQSKHLKGRFAMVGVPLIGVLFPCALSCNDEVPDELALFSRPDSCVALNLFSTESDVPGSEPSLFFIFSTASAIRFPVAIFRVAALMLAGTGLMMGLVAVIINEIRSEASMVDERFIVGGKKILDVKILIKADRGVL